MTDLREQLKTALRDPAAAAALVGGPGWERLASQLPEAVRIRIERVATQAKPAAPAAPAPARPRHTGGGRRFFTDEEAQDLNTIPLSEIMLALGAERLERSGTWQMWRLQGAKFGTNDRDRTWHDFSVGQGSGGAIRLIRHTEGLGFYEAVQWLYENFGGLAPAPQTSRAATDPATRAALRPLIAQVRDIPLADVVRAHGHDGGLRLEGEAFWDRSGKKRYGGLDLAVELRGGFAAGVAFLVENFRPDLADQLPSHLRRGPGRVAPEDGQAAPGQVAPGPAGVTRIGDGAPSPSPRHNTPPEAAMSAATTGAATIGAASTRAAAAEDGAAQAEAAEARPLELPESSAFHWPAVRRYLTEERGLSAERVDYKHNFGDIYADAAGRAVFVMAGALGDIAIAGAEIRGIGPGAARAMAPGTQKSAGSFMTWAGNSEKKWPPQEEKDVFVLVESAIDALSVSSLVEQYNTPDLLRDGVVVVSTGGVRATVPDWLLAHIEEGAEVLVGYDNDEAGDRAAEALIAAIGALGGQARRLRPEFGKDFNDELVARHAMAAEAEAEAALAQADAAPSQEERRGGPDLAARMLLEEEAGGDDFAEAFGGRIDDLAADQAGAAAPEEAGRGQEEEWQ